ncbi:MarR family winged helix-turn-helix transcriptional regulator [Rhizobium miluonense]|uniref:DNA-binding transcriptional regulator, MarR family n=1 Tax=Rhizobium miluonense TaxID=411945 RepID=A0A1C3X3A1_9HYPH|nr:MarR family transcriptional regulator [Rhizobium miluonense]SCB46718.1 DNA-binding transcriptional regulator, MarR family [Rhizobium miluonense]
MITEACTPDLLDRSISGFMRYFQVHINPILHRAEFEGRAYSDYEIVVCMALNLNGTLRPMDLSRGLSLNKGSLTSVLRRLRELDLIARLDIPGDERSYRVALTARGKRFVRHLEEQRLRMFRQLFTDMTPEDIAATVRGFDLISAYLKRVEEKDARLVSQTRA